MPVLMDHKLYGQTGEKAEMEIPEAEVGLISGGIRNEEHKKLAQEMRKKCKTLIALGSCACYGGIPALANLYTTEEVLQKVYRESVTTDKNGIPARGNPGPDRSRVCRQRSGAGGHMSARLPHHAGDGRRRAHRAAGRRRPFTLSTKSVCDECPTIREKKAASTLKRRLEAPEFTPGAPLNQMRCLMEQGFLCNGPATRSGCGGSEGTPRCIRAYMPCEGCFGPLSEKANPMVDMMGALSSIGLDPKQIPDRAATFNRFSGAGRLRPLPRR